MPLWILLALAGGGYWYWRTRQPVQLPPSSMSSSLPTAAPSPPPAQAPVSDDFATQVGPSGALYWSTTQPNTDISVPAKAIARLAPGVAVTGKRSVYATEADTGTKFFLVQAGPSQVSVYVSGLDLLPF